MELCFFFLLLSIFYVNSADSLSLDDRKSRLPVLLGRRRPIGGFLFDNSAWADKINEQRHRNDKLKTLMSSNLIKPFHYDVPRRFDRSTNPNTLDFTVEMRDNGMTEELSSDDLIWPGGRDYVDSRGLTSLEMNYPGDLSSGDYTADVSSDSTSFEVDLGRNRLYNKRNTNFLPRVVRSPLKIH